jgi:putative tryptophan/tyrosine transport system substrate-binding protein
MQFYQRPRAFITLLGSLVIACGIAVRTEAQDRADSPLIGFLSLSNPTSFHDGFAKGLRDLGYVEGKTIYVERHFAGGDLDRLAGFANELVGLRPRVIFSGGSPASLAVSRATQTIPIVMAAVADPVAVGLVRSVSRPGGNITGLTVTSPELSGKRLQLLQEMIPSVRRVNVLVDTTDPVSVELLTQTRSAAQTLGLTLGVVDTQAGPEFQKRLSVLVSEPPDPVVVLPTSLFLARRQQLGEFFLKRKMPSIFGFQEHVRDGGLMSYGANIYDQFYRAATYVDKILKGTSASDLPIEYPTKFSLAINLKTARVLDLIVPPLLLVQADDVIE